MFFTFFSDPDSGSGNFFGILSDHCGRVPNVCIPYGYCISGVESLWEKVVPDLEDQEWDVENKDKYS